MFLFLCPQHLSTEPIPAECDNIKLPIECEIASRWDAYLLCDICRHFASVMLHFASLISHNLRCMKALKKSAGGAILPFFLLITYGHSQLSTIGGVRFFVAGGVRAFGGEALAQVVDFVVVLLKKKGGFFV